MKIKTSAKRAVVLIVFILLGAYLVGHTIIVTAGNAPGVFSRVETHSFSLLWMFVGGLAGFLFAATNFRVVDNLAASREDALPIKTLYSRLAIVSLIAVVLWHRRLVFPEMLGGLVVVFTATLHAVYWCSNTRKRERPFQFSIMHLIYLTITVSVLCALGRFIGLSHPVEYIGLHLTGLFLFFSIKLMRSKEKLHQEAATGSPAVDNPVVTRKDKLSQRTIFLRLFIVSLAAVVFWELIRAVLIESDRGVYNAWEHFSRPERLIYRLPYTGYALAVIFAATAGAYRLCAADSYRVTNNP